MSPIPPFTGTKNNQHFPQTNNFVRSLNLKMECHPGGDDWASILFWRTNRFQVYIYSISMHFNIPFKKSNLNHQQVQPQWIANLDTSLWWLLVGSGDSVGLSWNHHWFWSLGFDWTFCIFGPKVVEGEFFLLPKYRGYLGGGFKYFWFSSLVGEDSNFD